ncbi:hypothetical protein OHS58_17755 [Amycolatopsis sp. NBC_00348]|uniref:hypothetical protein n=1 Tax=Amycolatopsis sp. NBC_00348 TaxID=2975956 RepID=UPI002E26D91E
MTLLDDLVRHVRPALAEAADDRMADALVRRCRAGATGAERQTRVADRHGHAAVVDDAAGPLPAPSHVMGATRAARAPGE